MPTVFYIGAVKIKIFPHDHRPPHIHAIGPGCEAKFEIETCACYFSKGFSLRDLKKIQQLISDKNDSLMEAWHACQEN